MTSYSVLCELVLKHLYKKQTNIIFFKCKKKKIGVKLRPDSEGRLGSWRGLGQGVGAAGVGERRGNKFHQIKNNNPHVKIKFSILPNLFLFNPPFKCMQVLVKPKNLNTFILHVHI